MKGKERAFLVFSCFIEDFASAEATKGLSGRPLESFGPMLDEVLASQGSNSFIFYHVYMKKHAFFNRLGAVSGRKQPLSLSKNHFERFGEPGRSG